MKREEKRSGGEKEEDVGEAAREESLNDGSCSLDVGSWRALAGWAGAKQSRSWSREKEKPRGGVGFQGRRPPSENQNKRAANQRGKVPECSLVT